MSYVDAALMAFFVLILVIMCLCRKFTPTLFHGMMRRVVPELYYMKVQEKEEDQKKDRINKEAAKYLEAGTIGAVIAHVTATLLKDKVSVRIKVPDATLSVLDLLEEITAICEPDVLGKVKVDHLEGLDGFIHPHMLLHALQVKLRTMKKPPMVTLPFRQLHIVDALQELEGVYVPRFSLVSVLTRCCFMHLAALPEKILNVELQLPVVDLHHFLSFLSEFVTLPGFNGYVLFCRWTSPSCTRAYFSCGPAASSCLCTCISIARKSRL
jgi:hypothetical protein